MRSYLIIVVLMLGGLIGYGQTVTTQPSASTTAPAATQAQVSYVASVKGKVYHRADCRWVKSILPNNQVAFETRDEAERAGRRACGTCRP
ncbi:MAG: hypothetical protein FWD53_03665 [Phycisphaerales bacterium]|nr:hypothetical protein [Phycisphaerales bacterium]